MMERLLKMRPATLVVANTVAFGLILGVSELTARGDGVDACDESGSEYTGCGCLKATEWYPAGCYDRVGGGYDCVDGGGCAEDPE